MGFSTRKKKGKQLCKKLLLQLPYSPAQNRNGDSDDTIDSSILRSSSEDISDDSDSGGMPKPLMASDRLNVLDGAAFNFEDVLFSISSPSSSRISTLPLELQSTTYHNHPFARSLPSPKPTAGSPASYRWYMMGDSSRSEDVTLTDVLKPFFSFGTTSVPELGDDEYHGDDEGEENMSLLHGWPKTSCSSGMLFPSIFKTPKAQQKSFSSSSSSPRDQMTASLFSESSNCSEDSTYLMSKSNDWSERQLAFDLESVVDEDEDDKDGFENRLWMLQMEEDVDYFQRVPPPATSPYRRVAGWIGTQFDESTGCVAFGTRSASPSDLYSTINDVETSSFSSSVGVKTTQENVSLGLPTVDQARGRKGNPKQRFQRHVRHVSNEHGRGRAVTTLLCNKSPRHSSNRRRRRSLLCRGGDFSPKLSTVAEQPSKEDEAGTEEDVHSTSSASLDTVSGSFDCFDSEIEGLDVHEC